MTRSIERTEAAEVFASEFFDCGAHLFRARHLGFHHPLEQSDAGFRVTVDSDLVGVSPFSGASYSHGTVGLSVSFSSRELDSSGLANHALH